MLVVFCKPVRKENVEIGSAIIGIARGNVGKWTSHPVGRENETLNGDQPNQDEGGKPLLPPRHYRDRNDRSGKQRPHRRVHNPDRPEHAVSLRNGGHVAAAMLGARVHTAYGDAPSQTSRASLLLGLVFHFGVLVLVEVDIPPGVGRGFYGVEASLDIYQPELSSVQYLIDGERIA